MQILWMSPAGGLPIVAASTATSPTRSAGLHKKRRATLSEVASKGGGSEASSLLGAVVGSSGYVSASVAEPSQMMFLCPQCGQHTPLAQGVQKGNALWCEKDNKSYNSLVSRWQTNKRLRQWWNSLSKVERQGWFRKWQSLEAKRRFDFITFVEETCAAQELLEDEIDRFVTFEMWRRNEIIGGQELEWSEEQLVDKWKGIVESMRYECIFRRGQWLIPQFEGIERRSRKRLTLAQTASRVANVSDPEQMMSLWQGGVKALEEFAHSAPVTATYQADAGPAIASDARPEDMPQSPAPQNMMLEAIARQAIQLSQ